MVSFTHLLYTHSEEKSFEQTAPQHARHHIVRRPVGVAALISPWNLPLYLLSWKVT